MSGKQKSKLVALLVVMCLVLGQAPLMVARANGGVEWPDESNNIKSGPGSIELTKNAEPVEGKPGRWKITLTVTGVPVEIQEDADADVVLVIDTSGSMDNLGRMAAAKESATWLVDKLLGIQGIRVGLVSFATEATNQSGLVGSDSKQSLLDKIEALSAGGGTHTQAGIKNARLMLSASQSDHKFIILLSDGEPTYSYKLSDHKNPAFYDPEGTSRYSLNNIDVNAFSNSTAGQGNTQTTKSWSETVGPWPFSQTITYYYNHGNSAVAEATYAKTNGVQFYCVGLQPSSSGEQVLEQISSDNNYYPAQSETLLNYFKAIAGSISSVAAKDAHITDHIGEQFTLVTDEPMLTLEPNLAGMTVSATDGNRVVNWYIPEISEAVLSLSYIVEISPEAESGQEYYTNGATYISYENAVNGEEALKHFPIPMVSIEDEEEPPEEPTLSVTSYVGYYDGYPHGVDVDFTGEGQITYKHIVDDEETWTTTAPTFTDVGVYDVSVRVEDSDFAGVGTVTIKARPLEIKAADANKVYDGSKLTANTYSIVGPSSLADTDKLVSVTVTGSQTEVGSSANVPSNAIIVRKQGDLQVSAYGDDQENVSDNYHITYTNGKLEVTSAGGGGDDPPPYTPPVIPDVPIPDEPIPGAPLLDKDNHYAYIQGYPNNTVQPEGLITREEVAVVFFRLLDADYRETVRTLTGDFPDVDANRWSSKHISTLATGGVIDGYTDGTFKPSANITRAELATIASKFDELDLDVENVFPDVEGHWAEKYINSAAAKGWVDGYTDGTFKPDQFITRAEFVALVNRVLGRNLVRVEDILEEAKQFPDLLPTSWYYVDMIEAINSHLYERQEDGYETWVEIIYPVIEM